MKTPSKTSFDHLKMMVWRREDPVGCNERRAWQDRFGPSSKVAWLPAPQILAY